MSWGNPIFVILIVAVCYGGWLINNWIRARHGYPVENEYGGTSAKSDLDGERKIKLLADGNARLEGKVTRLEERIAVLERIATDAEGSSARLGREIEDLKTGD